MNTDIKQAQGEIRGNIIEMFEIDKLPVEEQEDAINKISQTIFETVLMRVLPTLSEEDLAEYEKMIENNVSPDELMNFFFDKVENFMQIIAEESENFRKEAANILSKIK